MRESFESALAADPYDIPTRLIYADWLEEHGRDDEAREHRRRATPEWCEADRYMRDIEARAGDTVVSYGETRYDPVYTPITYEMLIEAGRTYLDGGGRFIQRGRQDLQDMFYGVGKSDEFWRNWSVITGVPLDGEYTGDAPFGCSC